MELVNLLLIAIFSENIVLTKFLGLCPFTTSKEKNGIVMGLLILLVMLPVCVISYFFYEFVLIPYDITSFMTLFLLILILLVAKLLDLFMKVFFKNYDSVYRNYLPFVVINSSILGIALWNVNRDFTLPEMLIYALGSGIGLSLILYIFDSIQDQMKKNPIPSFLKGAPILLFTGAIIALIFERFIGL